MIQSYKDLTVWQKAIELAKRIYTATGQLPKIETYGLRSQMQRASVSIASNIAEGYRRRNPLEYCRFLRYAIASAAELETQIIISADVYPDVNFQDSAILVEEVQKMIHTLISKVRPVIAYRLPTTA